MVVYHYVKFQQYKSYSCKDLPVGAVVLHRDINAVKLIMLFQKSLPQP